MDLEYFWNDTDPLSKLSDEEMAGSQSVCGQHWHPTRRTSAVATVSMWIRNYTDRFENLFSSQWNDKYKNQNHSMLTARIAVETIIVKGVVAKDNIQEINIQQDDPNRL